MRSATESDIRREFRQPRSDPGSPKAHDDPGLDVAYRVAEAVMDIAGPLFWAALVLAFMTGALGIDLFH